MNSIPDEEAILTLKKQKAHKTENQTVHAITKNVHFVVKNSPFVLNFVVNEDCPSFFQKINKKLTQNNIKVGLMYDDWDHTLLGKEVDYVKSEPFSSKIKVDSAGKKIDITVRIKVLTSQLEDMLFRIGVAVVGDSEDPDQVDYEYFSHPIRVISKVKKETAPVVTYNTPVKKNTKRKNCTPSKYYDDIESPPSEEAEAFDDLLSFENNQIHQTHLLESLRSKLEENENLTRITQNKFSFHLDSTSSPNSLLGSSSPFDQKEIKQEVDTSFPQVKQEPASKFQKSFQFLLNAYSKIPETQKSTKVNSLLKRHIHIPDLQEMMDLLRDQTTQRDQGEVSFSSASNFSTAQDPIFRQPFKKFHLETISLSRSEEDLTFGSSSTTTPSSASLFSSSSVSTECCHKRELNRIEAFYEGVFTNGLM